MDTLSFTYPAFEAKVSAEECKGDRNAKPQPQNGQQSGEWNGSRRAFGPQHQIQNEKEPEDDPTGKKEKLSTSVIRWLKGWITFSHN